MKAKFTLLITIIFSTINFTQANAHEIEGASFDDSKNYITGNTTESGIAKNFEGPAISIGLGLTGYSAKYEYRSSSRNSEYDLGRNTMNGIVNLSYLKSVNNKWLIGGGISYDINSSSTGYTKDDAAPGYKNSTKYSQHFSIYVQPTYALNETTSIFAKVGYHSTKVSISDYNGHLYSTLPDFNQRLRGIGYGFGIMTFLNKNVFLKTEIEFVDYGKTHIYYPSDSGTLNYKLTSASGIASIGYRF